MQHQGGGQLSSRWRHSWLASVFLFLLSSHMWWLKGTRRGRIREKNRERLIPSWGTTIKTLCQPGYLPKALLPNIITLGVKGRHNSIQSKRWVRQDQTEKYFVNYEGLQTYNFALGLKGQHPESFRSSSDNCEFLRKVFHFLRPRFLHLWDGTDDINTCSHKSGVLWWGGEKGVKWATFA